MDLNTARHRHPWCIVTALLLLCAGTYSASGQAVIPADPFTLDSPTEWTESYFPPPWGVIAYGAVSLLSQAEEGGSFQNPLRGGIMLYYDAWQVAYEMRPEAHYIRLMPRTMGRDGYFAAVFEYGMGSVSSSADPDDPDGAMDEHTVSESRVGMGISAHTGSAETVGARFIFDMTYGLIFQTDNIRGDETNFYYGVHLGLLLRVPIESFAACVGPYLNLGSGPVLYDTGYISSSESYFGAGVHVEVALNFNRPHYLGEQE